MQTILVLTYQPGFGSAITSALDPKHWRVIVQEDAASAAPLFARKAIDAVVLDVASAAKYSRETPRSLSPSIHQATQLTMRPAPNTGLALPSPNI